MSETLQKLLRRKRWEPSQEHQEQLASRILNQIEAERAVQPGLRSRIAELLDFKAALACAFSAIATGLLLLGLGWNEEKPRLIQPIPWSPDNRTLFVDERRFYNADRPETFSLPSLESAREMLSYHAWRTPTVSNIQATTTKPSPPFPTFRNPQLPTSYERSVPFPFNTNRLLQPASFHR